MTEREYQYESGPWEEWDADMDDTNQRPATAEEMRAFDRAIGMRLISIRLDDELIDGLKAIAAERGILYQPMIREVLERFAARNRVKSRK
jgi:predicted DNA binding CopG/RHH family protein